MKENMIMIDFDEINERFSMLTTDQIGKAFKIMMKQVLDGHMDQEWLNDIVGEDRILLGRLAFDDEGLVFDSVLEREIIKRRKNLKNWTGNIKGKPQIEPRGVTNRYISNKFVEFYNILIEEEWIRAVPENVPVSSPTSKAVMSMLTNIVQLEYADDVYEAMIRVMDAVGQSSYLQGDRDNKSTNLRFVCDNWEKILTNRYNDGDRGALFNASKKSDSKTIVDDICDGKTDRWLIYNKPGSGTYGNINPKLALKKALSRDFKSMKHN